MMQGYQALREGAAWLDLSSRGRIKATGDDRVRLLHAMCSNHIEALKPGQSCYAFFLNPQGRILADAVILALPDALWIGTEPETRHSLYAHLDKYIIADDVTLEDTTDATVQLGVEGPSSPLIRSNVAETLVVPFSTTGQPGFSIVAPAAMRDTLIRDLEAAGAVPASAEEARIVRLELGHPRYGEDISDRWLPHETQVLSALHFNKGCYIGQEIVERIRSRGGVHRFLTPFEIEGEIPPPPGAKVLLEEKEVGEITSAAFSPAQGIVVALGYLRLEEIPQGAALSVAGRPAHQR
jgi:aminomethyltransferase